MADEELNLSKNLKLSEYIFSETASKHNINNALPDELLPKAKLLAETIFEPVREILGNQPLHVDSGFRCLALNALLPGSSSTSQHCKAEALDLLPKSSLPEAFLSILQSNLKWDQLILENGSWIHISSKVLTPEANRGDIKWAEYDEANKKYNYHTLTKEAAITYIQNKYINKYIHHGI
jgi:hypothetical protein